MSRGEPRAADDAARRARGDPARVRHAGLLDTLVREQVAYAFLAPVLINMLLSTPGVEAADFSALEKFFYGASPISEDVLLRAKARLKLQLHPAVWANRNGGRGTYLKPEAHDPALGKLRACGVPWPEFEVRIVTPEGVAAGVGEVGEIQLRSAAVMKGYWNRPEATADAIDADGWFKTGDAGFTDSDGYVFIHDRVKDMIVTGGENVYPAEVENAIFGHPAVSDVAVIGVPDERWGEAVKAIVVLRSGVEPDTAGIIAYARERIAGYKAPKSVDYAEMLPRNPSGKVLRRELRAPYWAGRERQVS
jgi:fatty-acyl-CoA synthase